MELLTRAQDAIRYLSSHDNSYIRYFRGHTGPVTSLTLSPSDDTFLSSSLDGTVRLWDLRSANAQGLLHLYAPHLATYDPTATVIAIASPPAQSILLYDARNYDKAPFATFDVRAIECAMRPDGGMDIAAPDWTTLQFSNDGGKLLVGTNGPGHYLLDAYDGRLVAYCARPASAYNASLPTAPPRFPPAQYAALRERQSAAGKNGSTVGATSQGDVCFSPDGRYVVSGAGPQSQGGGVYVYDSAGMEAGDAAPEKTLQPICNLMAGQEAGVKEGVGKASVVGYSPRHNLMVTADRGTVFWLPEMD